MGGITISYYYAVDFQAVIDIVNAMGGVMYDSETCTYDGPNAVLYDGAAALSYLRNRAHNEEGDRDRTARQRAMLTAMFHQLKASNLLTTVPSMIYAAGSGIDTNATLTETAALASYAATANSLTINSRILDGQRLYRHDWTFSFVDNDLRSEIIREVFGFDPEPVLWSSPIYEDYLHYAGFRAMKTVYQAECILNYINDNFTEEALTEEQKALYRTAYASYLAVVDSSDALERWYLERYTLTEDEVSEEERTERSVMAVELGSLEDTCRDAMEVLAVALDYPEERSWIPYSVWSYDLGINEVMIDFN